MSTAQAAWLQAYATILAGLAANPGNRANWVAMRQVAKEEANEACRILGVSIS